MAALRFDGLTPAHTQLQGQGQEHEGAQPLRPNGVGQGGRHYVNVKMTSAFGRADSYARDRFQRGGQDQLDR